MANTKVFHGSSREDLVEQVNNWLRDQILYGDENFKVVGDEHGQVSHIYTIEYRGVEYVEEQSGPSWYQILLWIVLLVIFGILIIGFFMLGMQPPGPADF